MLLGRFVLEQQYTAYINQYVFMKVTKEDYNYLNGWNVDNFVHETSASFNVNIFISLIISVTHFSQKKIKNGLIILYIFTSKQYIKIISTYLINLDSRTSLRDLETNIILNSI